MQTGPTWNFEPLTRPLYIGNTSYLFILLLLLGMKGKVIEEPCPPPEETEQDIPLETLTISENTAENNDTIEAGTVDTEAGAYNF